MVSHPQHPHPLTKITDTHSLYPDHDGRWECDNCKESFDSRHHPYHCSICSYDLCEVKCFSPYKHILHHPSHNLHYSDMTKIYAMYNGQWKCDGCEELKDPAHERFAYHCFNDQFDICQKCYAGRDFSIHIHPLKPADTAIIYDDAPGYWVCDSCKRSGSEIGTRISWHCTECEFDACKRCLKGRYIPQHPEHPLKITDPRRIYPAHNGVWQCDICSTTYTPFVTERNEITHKPFHCFTCDFDACSNCVPNIEPVGMDVPAPPHLHNHNVVERDRPKADYQPPVEIMDDDDASCENLEDSQKCIVCINRPKNATIVHGNTGHVCCCLSCAYTLQRRGDACPICRAPIDRVIKHFTS